MDEDYSGLPLEESPEQERQSVKLFTMSQEDFSPRRSRDLSKGGSWSLLFLLLLNSTLLAFVLTLPEFCTKRVLCACS